MGTNRVGANDILGFVADKLSYPPGMEPLNGVTPKGAGAPPPPAQKTLTPAPEPENVRAAPVAAQMAVELPSFEETTPEPSEAETGLPGELESDSEVPESPEAGTEPEGDDDPKEAIAENFRKLRGVVKEFKTKAKEVEADRDLWKAKAERYERGEHMPDVIAAKDRRIAELEPLEMAMRVRTHPEYVASIKQPIIEKRAKLHALGESYNVPPAVMDKAIEIDNPRERNTFLSKHFDDIGGFEAKTIINELHELGTKALKAHNDADTALQDMEVQYQNRKKEEDIARNKKIEVMGKTGWSKALEKTKKEGAYKELIVHPTNQEFNKTVVEPIQSKSATQYGALLTQLSKNGLQEMPEELATGLARMVQMSIGGALALEAKAKLEQEVKDLKASLERVNQYRFPSVGRQNGSANGRSSAAPALPSNSKEAGEMAVARSFGPK